MDGIKKGSVPESERMPDGQKQDTFRPEHLHQTQDSNHKLLQANEPALHCGVMHCGSLGLKRSEVISQLHDLLNKKPNNKEIVRLRIKNVTFDL